MGKRILVAKTIQLELGFI